MTTCVRRVARRPRTRCRRKPSRRARAISSRCSPSSARKSAAVCKVRATGAGGAAVAEPALTARCRGCAGAARCAGWGGGGDPRQLARPNMPRRGFLCGSTWSRLTSVYASSTRPTRCGRKPRRCTRRASTLRGRDARATTPCWTTSRRGSCARRTRRSGRQRGPGGGLTRSRSCGPLSGRRFSSTFSATASLSQSTERSSMLSTKTLAS